jgi:hypothetical protein
MRAIGVTLLNVLAVLVFSLGLLSPLTPSYGVPRPVDVILFVGVPIMLVAAAFAFSRWWQAKLLAIAELGTILATASWLFWLQCRTS